MYDAASLTALFTTGALLSLRVAGLLWLAPIFSARPIPNALKAAITVLLVVLLIGSEGPAPRLDAITVLSELLIGLMLGFGAAIFVSAAESAGDMLAVQMGLSGANVMDPMQQTQLPVLGHLMGLMVTTLLLASGGHLAMLGSLSDSMTLLPPGTPLAFDQGLVALIELGGMLLWLGLRFAAPVVATMTLANVAMGVLARAVPQLNALSVAFPVQIGVGLLLLSATVPLIASAFAEWPATWAPISDSIIGALGTDSGAR